MRQFNSLAKAAATDIEKLLPEEALTQIYQAGSSASMMQSRVSSLKQIEICSICTSI